MLVDENLSQATKEESYQGYQQQQAILKFRINTNNTNNNKQYFKIKINTNSTNNNRQYFKIKIKIKLPGLTKTTGNRLTKTTGNA